MNSKKNIVRIILTVVVILGCAFYIQRSSLSLAKPSISKEEIVGHVNVAKADAPPPCCSK